MHLADGIVQYTPLVLGVDAAGFAGVAVSLRRAFAGRSEGTTFTGVLAAFVLGAQTLNFPIVPGSSAHVIGCGLLTLLLGPAQAVAGLFSVLLVQALFLGDGGLSVLGINALTMAVLPALVMWGARRAFGATRRGLAAAAVVGTLTANALGAALLALVLIDAAGAPAATTFAWLVGVQSLSGLLEGGLTALAVLALERRAPELVWAVRAASPAAVSRRLGLYLAALGVLVTLLLLPFASRMPDALAVTLEHLRQSH